MASVTVFSNDCHARERHTSVSCRISGGATYIPLQDWSAFFGKLQNSRYEQNNPNIYGGIAIQVAFGSSHAFHVGTELTRTTATLFGVSILKNTIGDTLGILDSHVIKWTFQGVPLTFGYEYRFLPVNEHIVPFIGLGASYFNSQVKIKYTRLLDWLSLPEPTVRNRIGKGYGAHVSLGVLSQVTRHILVISKIRYRYSDGMAFTDNKGDIKVEFTGFDVSLGIGWVF